MGWWPCCCGGSPEPCGGCTTRADTMAFVIAGVIAGAGGKACCTDINDTWTADWRASPYSTLPICNYHSIFECGSLACCSTTFTYTPGFPSPPVDFQIDRIITDLQIEPDGSDAYAQAVIFFQTDTALPPAGGIPPNIVMAAKWEASGLPADCTTWSDEVFTLLSSSSWLNTNLCDFSGISLLVSSV